MVTHRLPEAELQAARYEVVPFEDLAKGIVSVLELLHRLCGAEWQRVEEVRLLGVVVWADLVDPQRHFLTFLVAVVVLAPACEADRTSQRQEGRARGHRYENRRLY